MSDLNLVYACTRDNTLMMDVLAHEISKKDLETTLKLAHPNAAKYIEPQIRLAKKVGKQMKEYKLSMITKRTLEKTRSLPEGPIEFRAAMAENGDFHEPSPKVPKLSEEGSRSLAFFKVKKLSPNAILPSRASALAAGYDLFSAAEVKVPARGKALVPTDLSIAIPEDTYARIAPRSGLTWKHSIDVGAGVVDADYRGPVGVILFNHSDLDFEVKPGDRIAQLIIQKIITPDVEIDDDLDSTVRGSGGFGSTGV